MTHQHTQTNKETNQNQSSLLFLDLNFSSTGWSTHGCGQSLLVTKGWVVLDRFTQSSPMLLSSLASSEFGTATASRSGLGGSVDSLVASLSLPVLETGLGSVEPLSMEVVDFGYVEEAESEEGGILEGDLFLLLNGSGNTTTTTTTNVSESNFHSSLPNTYMFGSMEKVYKLHTPRTCSCGFNIDDPYQLTVQA